jgi:pimeloyl-ACP methyl ester carboxylesterase
VSLGGRVALEVALARPDLVERLVLVGVGLPGHAWSDTVRTYGLETYVPGEDGSGPTLRPGSGS